MKPLAQPQPFVIDTEHNGIRRRTVGYGHLELTGENTFAITIAQSPLSHRAKARAWFGQYRLPGDKPLISNGKARR